MFYLFSLLVDLPILYLLRPLDLRGERVRHVRQGNIKQWTFDCEILLSGHFINCARGGSRRPTVVQISIEKIRATHRTVLMLP